MRMKVTPTFISCSPFFFGLAFFGLDWYILLPFGFFSWDIFKVVSILMTCVWSAWPWCPVPLALLQFLKRCHSSVSLSDLRFNISTPGLPYRSLLPMTTFFHTSLCFPSIILYLLQVIATHWCGYEYFNIIYEYYYNPNSYTIIGPLLYPQQLLESILKKKVKWMNASIGLAAEKKEPLLASCVPQQG